MHLKRVLARSLFFRTVNSFGPERNFNFPVEVFRGFSNWCVGDGWIHSKKSGHLLGSSWATNGGWWTITYGDRFAFLSLTPCRFQPRRSDVSYESPNISTKKTQPSSHSRNRTKIHPHRKKPPTSCPRCIPHTPPPRHVYKYDIWCRRSSLLRSATNNNQNTEYSRYKQIK